MGDDLTDVVVMRRVGLAIATANARPEVKRAAHYVTTAGGGSGAMREVCEMLLQAHGHWADILRKYEVGMKIRGLRFVAGSGPGVLHELTGVIAQHQGDILSVEIIEDKPPDTRIYFRDRVAGRGSQPGGRARRAADRTACIAGRDHGEGLRQAHHYHGRRRAGGAGGARRDLGSRSPQYPRRAHLGGHDSAGGRAGTGRCGARQRRGCRA